MEYSGNGINKMSGICIQTNPTIVINKCISLPHTSQETSAPSKSPCRVFLICNSLHFAVTVVRWREGKPPSGTEENSLCTGRHKGPSGSIREDERDVEETNDSLGLEWGP